MTRRAVFTGLHGLLSRNGHVRFGVEAVWKRQICGITPCQHAQQYLG